MEDTHPLVDLFLGLLFVAVLVIFAFLFARGLDRVIENQDRMLCFSAKQSGNEEYLIKCQCYYLSGDIKCLQK